MFVVMVNDYSGEKTYMQPGVGVNKSLTLQNAAT